MKTLTLGVPTGGKVIVVGKKAKYHDPRQQDLFDSYHKHWDDQMLALVLSMPMPVAMSQVRQRAGQLGLPTALDPNWYGALSQKFRKAGLQKVGFQNSPLKSRSGGTEFFWDRKPANA